MFQDLAQLTDGYGKEKADVLFASCNTHFYGRVSSSFTAERLSKQFGKEDKVYTTASKTRTGFTKSFGQSESVQERDAIKPADFLSLEVGQFAGIAVESNKLFFKAVSCELTDQLQQLWNIRRLQAHPKAIIAK